jgi:hypothetical protein
VKLGSSINLRTNLRNIQKEDMIWSKNEQKTFKIAWISPFVIAVLLDMSYIQLAAPMNALNSNEDVWSTVISL